MASKTERLEARVSPAERALIEAAAKLEAMATSTFLVHAATKRASDVLERQHVTRIPPKLFDRLAQSLDEADPAPRLAAAVRRVRKRPRIA